MRVTCPAKINLHLRVGGRRVDGFHPLSSWMCTVGLFDNLHLHGMEQAAGERSALKVSRALSASAASGGASSERPPHAGGPVIALSGDHPGLPYDERNLIVRAAEAWRRTLEETPRRGAEVHAIAARLEKRIPIGGGLGGGSSNAARMLAALNVLWRSNASAEELSAFAARFGSDLSFFFFAPSAVCTGRGEVVRPIAVPKAAWVVLVLPNVSMPTAAVYARFDELNPPDSASLWKESDLEPDWEAWTALPAAALLDRLVNDLEPAAFSIEPTLGTLRRAVETSAGRPVRMSGSGSTLFTLFDSAEEAKATAQQISKRYGVRAIAVPTAPPLNDDLHINAPIGGA